MNLNQVSPLLSPQQIGELASNLDAIHTRALKAIERLNQDVASRKAEIANRWKSAGIDAADKARFAQSETVAAVRQIKDNSAKELDKLLKDAGAPHAQLVSQREFYSSPAKVLARAALGDPKRTEYLHQLAYAGPAELGHMAQVAVATQNIPLASALLSLLDRMPSKDRPVGPAELAAAMKLDDYLKVQEYIKLGDARLQGILIAIRSWNQGKSNPLNTVQLALREQAIDRSLLISTVRNDADGSTTHDAQRQNAQQALCVHAALFLLDPNGRLELVCLLDKEGSRTSVQTNLIFNGNFFDVHSKTLLSIIVLGNSICFLPVALYLF